MSKKEYTVEEIMEGLADREYKNDAWCYDVFRRAWFPGITTQPGSTLYWGPKKPAA